MIRIHGHDVLVAGDGPIGPELAVLAAMYRIFLPQPLEISQGGVRFEKHGMAGIEALQREVVGAFRDVHGPLLPSLLIRKAHALGLGKLFVVFHGGSLGER